VSPPGRPSSDDAKAPLGCSHLAFDASSNLLAAKLYDSPSTVWIWDVGSLELRAVLLFHAEVATLSWHPTIRETLLLRCDDGDHHGLVFVWDPLTNGPVSVDRRHGPLAKQTAGSKPRCMWLNCDGQDPVVFFSDGADCWLAAPMQGETPLWAESNRGPGTGALLREESPLDLAPAVEGTAGTERCEEGQMQSPCDRGSDSESEIRDDTFYYKLEGKHRPLGLLLSGDTDRLAGNEADH